MYNISKALPLSLFREKTLRHYMKKNLTALAFALFLSACGKHPQVVQVEAQYQPYFDAFKARAATEGYNVNITDLTISSVATISTDNVVAECAGMGQDQVTPAITVSQYYWTQLDVYYREELIFHEMGHCVLNRVHRPDQNNNLSLSIMDPYIFGDSEYTANYYQYMHELFYQQDTSSAFPLLFFSTDQSYLAQINALFNAYTSTSDQVNPATAKVMVTDPTAPTTTTLSKEQLAKLGCGPDHN
jgi:hypothetical protein